MCVCVTVVVCNCNGTKRASSLADVTSTVIVVFFLFFSCRHRCRRRCPIEKYDRRSHDPPPVVLHVRRRWGHIHTHTEKKEKEKSRSIYNKFETKTENTFIQFICLSALHWAYVARLLQNEWKYFQINVIWNSRSVCVCVCGGMRMCSAVSLSMLHEL